MKQHYLCILGLLLLLLFLFRVEISFAIENNIGGDPQNAGMGFTQVASNSGLLNNPASFGSQKLQLSMARSELYDIGLIYNYWEGSIRFKNSLRIGVVYEFVTDQDQIDNSGYTQQLVVLGMAYKASEKLQVGINLSQNDFKLFEENIGKGYSYDCGILAGPFILGQLSMDFGLKVENVSASREYKTERIETPKRILDLGLKTKCGNLSSAVDIKQDDIRLGVEYQVINALALRAGLAAGQLTLGLGVSAGRFQVDYAYWLSDVGVTHRVGTKVSF